MRSPSCSELPAPPAGKSGWPWTPGAPQSGLPAQAKPAETETGWPRITIVTPSYNQERYLEEAIRSVLLQDYPDIEYFVIDGGSTDGSQAIIRRYEKFLAGWQSAPDRGQSHAVNTGFAQASGQIYAFLNSDDRYEPGALRAVAENFRLGHSWVVGQVLCLSEGKNIGLVPQCPAESFTEWFLTCPVSQPGSFWAADLHRAAGPFREDLACVFDYEYWLRLRFDLEVEPAVIDRTLSAYRLHAESKSTRLGDAFAREAKSVRLPYRHRLSRAQRSWLWLVRRHRKARWHGSRVVPLFRERRYSAAAVQLFKAWITWPLLPFDRGVVLAARQWAGNYPTAPAFPDLMRDWDD